MIYRRREPDRDKLLNTAAVAPVMPAARRKRTSSPAAASPASAESAPIYGVPVLAAKVILANCLFWIMALAIVLSRQLDLLHFLMVLFIAIVALTVWFGLQWLISKAFWWFVVIYSSAVSIGILVAFVSRVLDAMDRVPVLPQR